MARTQSVAGHPESTTLGASDDAKPTHKPPDELGQSNSISDEQSCPECGERLRTKDIETVCTNCGLVTDVAPIDHGPEWTRGFERNTLARCNGAPASILHHDKGLGSEIGTTVATGRLHRQSEYQRRSKCEGGQRGLRYILSQIQRISSRLSLPAYATKDAAYYARRAHEQDIPGGRSLEWVTGGAVYVAIRESELPVRPDEVAEYLREDEATASGREGVLQAYSFICRELGLSITPMLPKDYLPRLFDALELNAESEIEVRRVLASVGGDTGGATASAVAAGAVRMVTKGNPDSPLLKEIAAVYGHNPRTVTNNARRVAGTVE